MYEKHAEEERKLRVKTVEALRRYEEQFFGKVTDFTTGRIIVKEEMPRSSRWSKPRVKMIYIQDPTESLEIEGNDYVLRDMIRRAEGITRSYQNVC